MAKGSWDMEEATSQIKGIGDASWSKQVIQKNECVEVFVSLNLIQLTMFE